MGDIADYYMEASMLEGLDASFKADRVMSDYDSGLFTWTTRDGKEMEIKDMTDDHVKNTLNMLNRSKSSDEYTEALQIIFEKEFNSRNGSKH